MNKLTLLLVSFFVLLILTSQGQNIGRYNFEEFDLAHKAGVPGVYSMFQDTTGVIWFGSTNGIYRYDGSRIFEFDQEQKKLLGKTNYSFLQAKNGDVLIGSDYGLCRYSIKFNTVQLLVHINRVFNNRSQYYPVCFDEKDQLWFVVSGIGVGMYNGNKVTWIESSQKMKAEFKISDSFFNTKTGDMYLAHYNGIHTTIFNVKTRYFTLDSLHQTVTFVLVDSNLYRIHSADILSVNLISGNRSEYALRKNPRFSENILYSKAAIVDSDWLWISLRDEVLRFNYRQKVFGKAIGYEGDTKSPLLRHISEMFKDKEGNLWICTETNGIKILNLHHLQQFQFLRDFSSSNNIIMDIEPVNDSLILVCPLVETPRLVNIITNSHLALLSAPAIGNSSFTATRINKSVILLTNQTGEIYSFNTISLQLKKLVSPVASFVKIIATSQADKLLIYNKKDVSLCTYLNGQIKVEKSIPLSYPAESFIYNPFSNLLYCSTQENSSVIDVLGLTFRSTQKPFSGSFIDYAWGKDKTLWLATRSGLEHYDMLNNLIESFNTSNGLNNDVIYSIQFNHDSTLLYLSTNLGISCFSIASKKIQNFTIADGLVESEHNGGASARDGKGNFYFGNIKGITVFNESFINQAIIKPFLIVQGIYIDDTVYNKKLNPDFIEQVHLFPENDAFGINYSLLSTSEPGKLLYSYKIDGIDNNFHRSNSAPAIRIPKPWYGTYTIILKGEVEDSGLMVEKRIELIVHAPFYLKWWFLIPVFVLFHAFLFIVIRRIIKNRVKKKQLEIENERRLYEQKSQIARELHDNVGARLSMMLNTVDWIGKKPLIEKQDLTEIKENTEAVIQGLRDAIWVMDKTQITVEELFDKIKYYTNQVIRNYPVQLTFDEVTHKPIGLNTTQALNLFRIVQESLNNALKYSKANQIGISLSYEGENGIIFKITDNGCGFEPGKAIHGHGLKNMLLRADEIKAKLNLQSILNEGTTVTVLIYIV